MRFPALFLSFLTWAAPAVALAAGGPTLTSLVMMPSATGPAPITVTAIAHCLPGQETYVRRAAETLRRQVQAEPDNLQFLLTTQQGAPGTFIMVEQYASEAAFQFHKKQPHTLAFNAALKGHITEPEPHVTFLSVVPDPAPVPAGLPRGIDHVGVTVPDLEAASRFFEQALGAEAVYDVQPLSKPPMQGADTEKQLGLPHGAKIVHMRLLRLANGPSLELFQLADAPHHDPTAINDYGYTHIALYVDDIQAAAQRFEAAGGKLLSPVHGLAGVEDGPGNAGVYGRTPWGSLVELLTYPAGLKYPDPARARWTPKP